MRQPQDISVPGPRAPTVATSAPVARAGTPPVRVPDGWVEPLRWAALVVWVAIPFVGLLAQPIAGQLVWTIVVAGLPLFIVLVGYHRWRRICPLAFCNQIMVRLRRPGSRRMPAAVEDRYYLIPVATFAVGLWLRLIWTNGDGGALALFFVGLSLVAFLIGALFTGKTWCNYICPVSFIEKIYTEPHGLRETPNSQCVKCTACKKACPDINQENGYWKEIESPTKRFAYFAYPGLVFGFYWSYWLQSGTWDSYYAGAWTDQPGVILHAFLPGTSPSTAGLFFWPAVPRAVAAAATLAFCALASFGLFAVFESRLGRLLRRRDPSMDAIRVRHIVFGLAAFVAFVNFYNFAGQPLLRKVEWLPAYTSVLVVLTASLLLVRRLVRTPQAFAEQSVARNIIKRWEWPDVAPPKDLHDAVVMHTARTSERERAYAQVLEAYQDAVRETLASGLVTRAEVQRLESLRQQLQIKRSDHERVMATLAAEERAVLSDPSLQPSAEERLQLETYARALGRYLEQALGAEGVDDRFIQHLRQEFRVTPEQHQAVLDRLLAGGEAEGTVAQLVDAVRAAERAERALTVLGTLSSPSAALLADLLRRARAAAIERLLRGVGTAGEADTDRLAEQLAADDEAQHSAALEALCARVPSSVGDRLRAAHAEAAALAPTMDVIGAYLDDPDAYVRAAALYALAERSGPVDASDLDRLAADEHALVRETAAGLRARRAAAPTAPAAASAAPAAASVAPAVAGAMLTIEKMLALRCVSIFASLGPVALEELAQASEDSQYGDGQALCLMGQPGDEVFVVIWGEVAVVEGTRLDGAVLRVEGAGSVIGEIAVLEAAPRSASVFATTGGAHVLRLNGGAFRAALNDDSAVAEGVIRSLARRIRTREVPDMAPAPNLTHAPTVIGGTAALVVLAVSAAVAAALLLGGGEATAAPRLSHACDGCPAIFRPFDDSSGQVRSQALDPTLDASNAFVDEDLGKNAQACYDCHQPRQGFSLLVPSTQ